MDELLPWLRRSGWAYIAVALALALVAWRMVGGSDPVQGPGSGKAAQVRVEGSAAPGEAADDRAAAGRLIVHVTGEVRRPGVYDLVAGARVQRAVARAGGPTARADLSLINMAAALQDGQQVVVPGRSPAGDGAPGAAAAAAGVTGAGPISLSSATQEQLETLDGIGPTLAGRIVAYRQESGGFASVDQLLEVQGIGPTRLESLRSRVVP